MTTIYIATWVEDSGGKTLNKNFVFCRLFSYAFLRGRKTGFLKSYVAKMYKEMCNGNNGCNCNGREGGK